MSNNISSSNFSDNLYTANSNSSNSSNEDYVNRAWEIRLGIRTRRPHLGSKVKVRVKDRNNNNDDTNMMMMDDSILCNSGGSNSSRGHLLEEEEDEEDLKTAEPQEQVQKQVQDKPEVLDTLKEQEQVEDQGGAGDQGAKNCCQEKKTEQENGVPDEPGHQENEEEKVKEKGDPGKDEPKGQGQDEDSLDLTELEWQVLSLVKEAFLRDKQSDLINNSGCYNSVRHPAAHKYKGGMSLLGMTTKYFEKFDCRLADALSKAGLVSVEHLVSLLSDPKRHLLELHYDDKGQLIMAPTSKARKRFAKEEQDERERNRRPMHPNLIAGLRNELLYTMPAGMAIQGDSYEQIRIPKEQFGSKKYIELVLCDLTNPSRMYFQMRKNLPLINKMMDDIESFYGNHRQDTRDLDIEYVRRDMIGLPIACQYIDYKTFLNHGWHRAVVIGFVNMSDLEVFFVDYGTYAVTNICHCRFLLKRFLNHPAQAIRGKLAGLIPYRGAPRWSSAAIGFLNNWSKRVNAAMGNMGGFVANVLSEKEEVVERLVNCGGKKHRQTFYRLEVVLYDTTSPESPPEGININDAMLKERLASPDHDCLVNDVLPWQKKEEGKPLPQEESPTTSTAEELYFLDMIETYHRYAEVIRRDREQRAREGRRRGGNTNNNARPRDAASAFIHGGPTLSLPEDDDSDGGRRNLYELEQKFMANCRRKCMSWLEWDGNDFNRTDLDEESEVPRSSAEDLSSSSLSSDMIAPGDSIKNKDEKDEK